MKNVLIIDDGVFMRVLIKGILNKNNYNVIGEAEDGLIGVEMYKALKPDIVTMDITMPNMDGITALKEILKYDSNACVVMVSAMGQEKYIKEAIVSGAKSFIVKPFDEGGLISVLEGI
ncbi:response regulator [Eubacteriales bacterium OttesenSCG-928-G02]|nr:response regulator [Eubacteriales bacterium OttesenSCG-928-G02]